MSNIHKPKKIINNEQIDAMLEDGRAHVILLVGRGIWKQCPS